MTRFGFHIRVGRIIPKNAFVVFFIRQFEFETILGIISLPQLFDTILENSFFFFLRIKNINTPLPDAIFERDT